MKIAQSLICNKTIGDLKLQKLGLISTLRAAALNRILQVDNSISIYDETRSIIDYM